MDDAIDELYGADLTGFTKDRDALAKQLRADGDRDAAAAVKALAKPTRAAWVLNRLVRDQPDGVAALGEAADALADAQQEVLAGGDAAALRQCGETARAAVDALVDSVPRGESGATRDAVQDTLRAAIIDPGVRAALLTGRLTKERAAAGFGGLETATPPARTRPRAKQPAKGATSPAKSDAQAKAREAEEQAAREREERRRRDSLRRAKEAEASAEAELDAAEQRLAQVETTRDARRAEVRDAKSRLADARRRRTKAERAG